MAIKLSCIYGLIAGVFCTTMIILVFKTQKSSLVYVYPSSSGKHLWENNDISNERPTNTSAIRVLCWIMTCQKNLHTKAIHVKNTWAKRCDKTLFVSDNENKSFPTIPINVTKGRPYLPMKTFATFDYIYQHHIEDADWFLKADDDTYVIIENLKYFLSTQDPNKPLYFGHHLNWKIPGGFHSGGSGYVISNEALKRYGQRRHSYCKREMGPEDVFFGACMKNLNIVPGDSRDKLGRYRFYPYKIEKIIANKFDGWYYKYAKYGAQVGIGNLSDYPIAFHYIKPHEMYAYEYFTYHLRAFGKIYGMPDLNMNTSYDS